MYYETDYVAGKYSLMGTDLLPILHKPSCLHKP